MRKISKGHQISMLLSLKVGKNLIVVMKKNLKKLKYLFFKQLSIFEY